MPNPHRSKRPGLLAMVSPVSRMHLQSLRLQLSLLLCACLLLVAPASWAQDLAAGKAAFAACAACHAIDSSNSAGPGLQGINGREAGRFPGFRFSKAMKSLRYAWGPDTLDAFIADPQQAVPGNLMPYSGLPDAAERAALVAYLLTLK